jgi:hypothetical protein
MFGATDDEYKRLFMDQNWHFYAYSDKAVGKR